jgi:hypothetical protein
MAFSVGLDGQIGTLDGSFHVVIRGRLSNRDRRVESVLQCLGKAGKLEA